MKIVFDVPHGFSPESTPAERASVWHLLNTALDDLVRDSQETHVVPTLVKSGGSKVTFDLPHVFRANSTPHENAKALQTLLSCLTDLNSEYLKNRGWSVPELYQSGVRYRRTTVWDTIPVLYYKGFGDCKSLACALAAQYTMQGIPCKTVFRWIMGTNGRKKQINYHILVQTPWGVEDPSKVTGMGLDENAMLTPHTG